MAVRSLFPGHPIMIPTPTVPDTEPDRLAVGGPKLLGEMTTLGIGGPCSFFLEATRPAHLASAARMARSRSLPLIVLGRGSNCLFSDRGFDGLVVINRSSDLDTLGPGRVRAASGFPFNRLGVRMAAEGWGGLEFAGGIPGTVGGAAFMNAGANGQETAEAVESVEVLDREGGIRLLPREELRFSYRWSSLQEMEDLAAIVAVTFRLWPEPAARDRQREYLHWRRKTQPISERSAGSVFRNPEGCGTTAGELIDIAGLKGYQIGGAKVSELHANFIINNGAATAKDVLALIAFIKDRVDRMFGIELKEEIRYVPYSSV